MDCPYQFCDIPQYHYSQQSDSSTCIYEAPHVQDGHLTLLQEFPEFQCYSSWYIGPVYFLKFRESLQQCQMTIESFTLIKLSVTMSLMLALIFPSDSP